LDCQLKIRIKNKIELDATIIVELWSVCKLLSTAFASVGDLTFSVILPLFHN